MESESLQPHLDRAQEALQGALDEACDVDLRDVDTGELIRIEEALTVASSAAKEAVSVRLKMRKQRERGVANAAKRAAIEPSGPITQRVFDDIKGKRWRVFAVHPSAATTERASLPEAYRQGWLTFEAHDEMRRVVPIPERWEELSIDDLRMKCRNAASMPKRLNALEAGQPGTE